MHRIITEFKGNELRTWGISTLSNDRMKNEAANSTSRSQISKYMYSINLLDTLYTPKNFTAPTHDSINMYNIIYVFVSLKTIHYFSKNNITLL